MTTRNDTNRILLAAIGDDTLTGSEIAQRSGIAWIGVEAALKGMWRRGEVVKLKQRTSSEPHRYRLTVRA